MMNLLIAIMNDTFVNQHEVKDLVQMKVKLKFIIDNWWFDAIGEKKKKIKYVVAALKKEEPDDETEVIRNLQKSFMEFNLAH